MKNLICDEGHYFDSEDTVQYIKCKIVELLYEKVENDVIINFDDSSIWRYYSKLFLDRLNFIDSG